MAAGASNSTANADWGKANFNDIYDCPDPRRYFATLRSSSTRYPTMARPPSGHWPMPCAGCTPTGRH